MNPKISVIVPVYNVEKYLSRCIDSILAQTFTDFELLLIDDGSTDRSREICDEYAVKDARIRVFHKKNGGVSSARNVGLDCARGEWITFCDSDDELMPDAFVIFMSVSTDCDIIKTGFDIVNGNGSLKERVQSTKTVLTKDKAQIFYLCEIFHYCGFLWNSFIRKCIIGDTRFENSISWCEDHIFIYQLMKKAEFVGIVSNRTYLYYVNEDNKKNLSVKIHSPDEILYAAKLERKAKCDLIGQNYSLKSIIDTAYENQLVKSAISSFHFDGIWKTLNLIRKEADNPLIVFEKSYVQFLKNALKKFCFSLFNYKK